MYKFILQIINQFKVFLSYQPALYFVQFKYQLLINIMESAKDITNFQKQEFNKIRETYPIDQNIENLWKNYYVQYRNTLSSIQTEKVHLHLKCAYFLAQKSTWITTMNGQRVRNVSISLSELLKKNALQQVMFTLKDYSNKVQFEEENTLQDLQKTIKQISFMITFYSKFQKIITKLQIKQKEKSQNSYSQTLIQFIWLMYIECKAQILKRSLQLIDNTCMLAHTMSFMLVYAWEYYQPPYFLTQKNLTKNSSIKQINMTIKEKVLQLFLIKNIDNYKHIALQLEKYFNSLQQKNIIKITNGKYNFLSPELINLNYKRLDHYYQKKLDISHLDQRLFFKDGVVANITPFKFTPFNRQKIHIPLNKTKLGNNFENNQNKSNHTISYNSHRVLTYDNIQNQQAQNQHTPTDIKLPKTVIPSPNVMKNTLLQQTPYTNGLLMYNYVNEIAMKINQKKYLPRRFDKLVFQLIDKILNQKCKDLHADKTKIIKKLIFSVFKPMHQEYLAINLGQEQNQSLSMAFLMFSIEIVFFSSNIEVSFKQIQSYFQAYINPLDEWKACDYFQKFDKNMHINIKVHFLDIEVDLISSKIWKNNAIIEGLSDFYNNIKNSSESGAFHKLGRRILHQIAYQITQVCKQCIQCPTCQESEPVKHCQQCRKIIQSISQQSFQIMKETLLHKIQILSNQYMDQIILCIIFSICKIQQCPIKFNALVAAYKRCNQHNSDKHVDIIHNIQICQGQTADIIGYFNKKFVPSMQQFIRSKTTSTSRPQTRRVMKNTTNTIMQSPLTSIIPKQIAGKNYHQCFKGNNGIGKNNATPRLYAYNQSPLLKNEFTSLRTPANSKRALFEPNDQVQKINKQVIMEQNSNMYQQNMQTNTYLKKFTTKSPCLIKSPVVQKGSMMNKSPITKLSNNSTNQTIVKQFHSQSYHSGHSGIVPKKSMLNR